MNDNKINIEEQLERFTDELIDDIFNTPDSEILQEVEEDYGTSDYLSNKFLEIFEKAKLRYDKWKSWK